MYVYKQNKYTYFLYILINVEKCRTIFLANIKYICYINIIKLKILFQKIYNLYLLISK